MKKSVIFITLLLLSFAGSAFAAAVVLAKNAVTPSGVTGVYGGVDATSAGLAPTALVRFSTGVSGLVNYESATLGKSIEYQIETKHITGSKIFGTASDSTAIYWNQSAAGVLTNAKSTATNNANFVGNGWTSY
jgi:hypothetical protein